MNVNIGNEEFLNTVKSIVGNEKKLNQNFNVTKKFVQEFMHFSAVKVV